MGYLAFVRPFVRDPEAQWSMGTFGAIAEFLHTPDEAAVAIEGTHAISVATERGSLHLEDHPKARLVAYETVGKRAGTWRHSVAMCLPEGECGMHRREVVTELGPDRAAVRAQDRESILFDLGLSLLQTDACIRTADRDLVAALRASEGRPLFAPGNTVMMSILHASPHRVFVTRLGRLEVFQPIPPPTGKSPLGPHTHILPKLLRAGRTHSATTPIPAGCVPCANLYPAHPQFDAEGLPRPFVRAYFDAFASVLTSHGTADLVKLQDRVSQAVRAGDDPATFAIPAGRYARASLRVALRKLGATAAASPTLDRWVQLHDRSPADDADDEDEHTSAPGAN